MSDLTFKQRFIEAQKQIRKVDKDSENPHYKSKYASLPAVLEMIRPILYENSLFYRTEVCENRLISYVEDQLGADFYKTEMTLLELSNMQKLGSSLTYAQRYSLLLLMGVAAGMDDDGNDACGKNDKKEAVAPAPVLPKSNEPKKRCVTQGELNIIESLMATCKDIQFKKWMEENKILANPQGLNFWDKAIKRLKDSQ